MSDAKVYNNVATEENMERGFNRILREMQVNNTQLKGEIHKLEHKVDKLEIGLKSEIKRVETDLSAKIDRVETRLETKINILKEIIIFLSAFFVGIFIGMVFGKILKHH